MADASISLPEGLSLRVRFAEHALTSQRIFPFLFGRAFIEAYSVIGGSLLLSYFPSLWEGLSLRPFSTVTRLPLRLISLPYGKGFH